MDVYSLQLILHRLLQRRVCGIRSKEGREFGFWNLFQYWGMF